MTDSTPSSTRRPFLQRLGRFLVRAVLGMIFATLALLAFGPMASLVVIGETRQGRLFGGVALGLFVASLALVVLFWRGPVHARPWWIIVGLASLASVGLGVALMGETPDRDPERSTGLVSRFAGETRVPRDSPANLLPEIDQVKLVVTLVTRPLFFSGRAAKIRETTMSLYREIETDPEARGLGPVTHFGMMEGLGADFLADHSFAYVPKARLGERLGMVVFLHGNGGNFQVVPWVWRTFAEEHRMVILCPTFGLGFWGKGGVEAVERARLDAIKHWNIDPSRVYLAGLSDGGVGVTRSALAHPDHYRGLIYISPTMNLGELGSEAFQNGWKGRKVLVAEGDRDWNVPKSTVDPAVDLLKSQGVTVDYRIFPGQDHFLFFSRSHELLDAVGAWME